MTSAGDEQDWCGSSDDGACEAGAPSELRVEWEARKASHWNSGYRDGLDEGKEQTLQQGFDEGYASGLGAGIGWGGAKGAARTLQLLEPAVPGLSAAVLQASEEAVMRLLDVPEPIAMKEICRPLLQGEQQAAAPGSKPSALLEAQAAVLVALAVKGHRPCGWSSAGDAAQLQ